MSWKDFTPEQRREFQAKAAAKRASWTPEERLAMREKSAATRRETKAKNATLVAELSRPLVFGDSPPIEEPDVAEPIVLAVAAEDDGLLTESEKAKIEEEQLEKAFKERHDAAKKAYAKEMFDKARREIGEMPVDEEFKKSMEEVVRIYIDMPRMRKPTGGEHDPEPIVIDGRAFTSGRYYDVPRAQAIYLQERMDQLRRHVNQVDGRSRTYYNAGIGQMIYQGGTALGGGTFGTSFDALHKRQA